MVKGLGRVFGRFQVQAPMGTKISLSKTRTKKKSPELYLGRLSRILNTEDMAIGKK